MGTLEERIRAIEDRDEIRELTARYCYAVVRQDGPALVEMFCEDGEMRMGERVMRGRDELLAGYSGSDLLDIAPKPFIQNHVVEPDPVPLRIHVQLAHAVGLVARVPERLGQRRQVRHRLGLAEVSVAVSPRAGPCHQRSSRRDADRAFAIGISKAHAAPR